MKRQILNVGAAVALLMVALLALTTSPPTAPVTAQDDATLQSFALADGSLQLDAPATWEIDFQGVAIALTNNEALLELGRVSWQAGDVLVQVYGFSEDSLLGVEEQPSPTDALTLIVQSQRETSWGQVQSFTVGDGVPAAEVRFSADDREGTYLALQLDDRIVTIASLALIGSYEQHALDIRTMATSLQIDSEQYNRDELRVFQDARIGDPDAPVIVYEFGTYGCHACRAVHNRGTTDDIKALVAANEGDVQFVFVNFPVIQTPQDYLSAEVGQCVLDTGQDAFWTFHDAMYEQVSDIEYIGLRTPADYIAFVSAQGLDATYVTSCLDERTHRATVRYHLNRTGRLGIRATPTFLVNEELARASNIVQLVEAALAD